MILQANCCKAYGIKLHLKKKKHSLSFLVINKHTKLSFTFFSGALSGGGNPEDSSDYTDGPEVREGHTVPLY